MPSPVKGTGHKRQPPLLPRVLNVCAHTIRSCVPRALCRQVLSGTKYGVRQERGKFGLGSKMACPPPLPCPDEYVSRKRQEQGCSTPLFYSIPLFYSTPLFPSCASAGYLDALRPLIRGRGTGFDLE
jgi:hypothetical protein